MKNKRPTEIEKMCANLVSIDLYSANLRVKKGLKTSPTQVKTLIKRIEANEISHEDAGFIPHKIADRWVVQPL